MPSFIIALLLDPLMGQSLSEFLDAVGPWISYVNVTVFTGCDPKRIQELSLPRTWLAPGEEIFSFGGKYLYAEVI